MTVLPRAPHVALVHDKFGGPTGMGLVAERLASYVIDAGWTLTVVGSRIPDWLHNRARVVKVRGWYELPALPQHIAWAAGAARAVRRLDVDLVHVHSPLLARFADVVTCHFLAEPAYERGCREEEPGMVGRLRAAQDRLTRATDGAFYRRRPGPAHYTFVSEFLRAEFTRTYGAPRGGWILAPPAPSWRPCDAAERSRARQQWSADDPHLVVGYLGGNNPRKGVRAVQALAADPAITLLAAGTGSESIHWAGSPGLGIVDVDELLPACDVLVSPSIFDSAPLAVLQALARGVPVVVSPTTGWAPAIARHGAGVVWNGTWPLADAVRQAAACDRAACRSLVTEFSDARQRRTLLDVYGRVLGAGTRPLTARDGAGPLRRDPQARIDTVPLIP